MHLICESAARGGCVGSVEVFHHFPERPGIEQLEALCSHHATQRGYYSARDKPHTLPSEGAAEVYVAFRAYRDARRTFVQRYNSDLSCHLKKKGGCTTEITRYYFSDGGKLPLCTHHVVGAPIMGDDGRAMSVEYYEQVYELDSVWCQAHLELMKRHR